MREKLLKHIEDGLALFESRDYEEAYSELSRAVHLIEEEDEGMNLTSTQISEIYMFRASSLIAADDHMAYSDPATFHQALDDFEAAIETQPLSALLYNLRGKTYLRATFEDFKEEAKADFRKALEIDPEEFSAMKSLGETLSKEGKYDAAIALFSRILDKEKDAETFMLRGVSNFKKPQADYAAAAADFGRAMDILPRLEELYVWRAQCFQELGQIEEAIEEYNQLIKISPRNPGYYIDRGVLLHHKDPKAALNDYSSALDIKPHPLAYNNRASLFAQEGKFEEAIKDAQAALHTDGTYGIAYATLAEIFARQKDREQMYHYLQLALENYFDDIFELLENPIFEPYQKEEKFQQLITRKPPVK